MATQPTPKAAKEPKAPVNLSERITVQLNRAVMARKMTKTELEKLQGHIEKLMVFVES